MTTIPVTDVQPGDLLDTRNAVPAGPIVRVGMIARSDDGRVYIAERDPGALVPATYAFTAGQRADVYSRA